MTLIHIQAPPDPGQASSPHEFVALLRELRHWAGQPSLRTLRRLGGTTTSASGDEVDALAPSTISYLLNGRGLPRPPRLAFVEAFVAACLTVVERPEEQIRAEVERWRQAWRTVTDLGSADEPTTMDGRARLPIVDEPAAVTGSTATVDGAPADEPGPEPPEPAGPQPPEPPEPAGPEPGRPEPGRPEPGRPEPGRPEPSGAGPGGPGFDGRHSPMAGATCACGATPAPPARRPLFGPAGLVAAVALAVLAGWVVWTGSLWAHADPLAGAGAAPDVPGPEVAGVELHRGSVAGLGDTDGADLDRPDVVRPQREAGVDLSPWGQGNHVVTKNGAQLALLPGPGPAGLQRCAAVPARARVNTVRGLYDLRGPRDLCVWTADGRVALLSLTAVPSQRRPTLEFRYVVWRPGAATPPP
jgi:hypothetical protein